MSGINNFSCKSTPSFLPIHSNHFQTYNTITEFLKDLCSDFHTFNPHPLRCYRVVIRNLHHTTPSTDISDALAEFGYSATNVKNIKKKNQRTLPLFYV